jgi:hypothetical protein
MTPGSGVNFHDLSQQVAKARSDEELVSLLRTAMANLDKGYALFRERINGKELRRVFWVSSGRINNDDRSTLASRGDLLEQVTTLHELDTLFHDTIAVAGRLALRMGIPQLPAAEGEWQLYWSVPGGERFELLTLPVSGDTILIERELFPASGNAFEVVLRNTRRQGQNLAHGTLLFLTAVQQEELREWMGTVLSENPELTYRQQVGLCARMWRQLYGGCYLPNIGQFLAN